MNASRILDSKDDGRQFPPSDEPRYRPEKTPEIILERREITYGCRFQIGLRREFRRIFLQQGIDISFALRIIERHHRESLRRAPTAAGRHDHTFCLDAGFGGNFRVTTFGEIRGSGGRIELHGFCVQEAVIACKRYRVAGAGMDGAARELICRVVAAVTPWQEILVIFDAQRHRRRTRMAAKDEIDSRVLPQNLPERTAEQLAVIAIE